MADNSTLPWYQSNVFVLAILGIVADIGSIISQAPEQVLRAAFAGDSAAIGQLVSLVALGLVAMFRARSGVQPLTLGNANRDTKAQLPVVALLVSVALTFCLLPGCSVARRADLEPRIDCAQTGKYSTVAELAVKRYDARGGWFPIC